MTDSRRTEEQLPTELLAEVLWRRLDQPGLEHCRLSQTSLAQVITGCVLTIFDRQPVRVDYTVTCDLAWLTSTAHVQVVHGASSTGLDLRRDESGVWWRDHERLPEFDGLTDVDLSLTPSTNTIPIRRLNLAVGEASPMDAVWIRFPGPKLERLPQCYTRLAERHYRYESRGGSFTAAVEVDDRGLVVRYGDIWERVAP